VETPDADPENPGRWVQQLEDTCRREAIEIRLNAYVDAERDATEVLASADSLIERRIARLRELRDELAGSSARIERDLVRAANEIRRRVAVTYPPQP
jgi:hypothetical protein